MCIKYVHFGHVVCLLPADTLSYIFVHLSEFGLQVGQKSVQQLRHPPLLLSQTPLQDVQTTAQKVRGKKQFY